MTVRVCKRLWRRRSRRGLSLAMNMQEVVEEARDPRILQGASVCPKESKDNDRSKSDMILV